MLVRRYVSDMPGDAKAITSSGTAVADAVRSLGAGRYLLAVSGGRDSMVLMHQFMRSRGDAVSVATFDHGTGPHAKAAAELVRREARRLGVPVEDGRRTARGAAGEAAGEAAWRASRWAFLHAVAARLDAVVVTAHTRDDQAETVFMRILRDAGARGLAAMYAKSAVSRPFLSVSRAELGRYAQSNAVPYVLDQSNDDPRHQRNRVRHDLLPALERVRPGFTDDLLALASRAAEWRVELDAVIARLGVTPLAPGRSLMVPLPSLAGYDVSELSVLWPAIAGRAGVRLDWRGTKRLAEFTLQGRVGARVPLSGGASVRRTSTSFVLETPCVHKALYSYNDCRTSNG